MALLDLNRNPSAAELRSFGRLLPVFGLVVGGSLWWRGHAPAVAGGIAGAILVAALVFAAAPAVRRPLYLGWISAVYPIGWVVSHVVLGAMYFLVITPIGLAVRWLRGDPLARGFDRQAATYWITRGGERPPESYLREF